MQNQSDSVTPTVGIDVGGTFTDFVAVLPTGEMLLHKQPSTPADPSNAVGEGLKALIGKNEVLQSRPLRVVHGTTIGLNAILQRKIPDVALVVSTGHRDVLEIGRARLKSSYSMHLPKELPIVPRDLVFEINARADSAGEVVTAPTALELESLVDSIRASGVNATAIMLLNSYIDGALEQQIADYIRLQIPGMLVSCSSDIWPEIREFERCVVTCINAQIHHLMARYLELLEGRVQEAAPSTLQLTSSSGGMLGLESAAARPIETILSGPASGATAAARLCAETAISSALTFDMGGTSADIAIITDGKVEFTTTAKIGELPLMMPVVGVSSIGAGGGSIVSVDKYGVIKVGPESAGANPGPVAYGLGGVNPTVTDCYLVLGYIDPDGFLGGSLKLNKPASEAALLKIAEKLGLKTAEAAAQAALSVATAHMTSDLFKLLAQKGYEPSNHVVIPFGGAGPTHSVLLAEEAGLQKVVVPLAAATFCALGAAVADLRRDFVRSLGKSRLSSVSDIVWSGWKSLRDEAEGWLSGEKVTTPSVELIYALDMQYAGQSFSLTVPIDEATIANQDSHSLAAAFHRAHIAIYGFAEPDDAVEVVSQRLSIVGEVTKAGLPTLAERDQQLAPRRQRPVFHNGTWLDAAIYRREDFASGSAASGPAVIEQDDTALWVPQGWAVTAQSQGQLVVERI